MSETSTGASVSGQRAPKSFGRYRLLRRLGAGGMGEVYLAEASGLDTVARKVAIKVVRQLYSGSSSQVQAQRRREKLRSLFVEEAKVSFLLNHPNIVQTYDIGEIDGHTFLVLEYVDGAGLERVLERLAELARPMPVALALYIGAQVARGLEYAHSFVDHDGRVVPIVHRDVSPGNVLISRRGQVKVADFGLAKSAMRKVESDHGTVKGKLAYMPPEQLRGADVDSRADVYALGIVLYEMIAGAHPFGDVAQLDYLSRLAQKQPPPPLSTRAAVSPHLSELVATCMANAAEDRFGSTREVVRLLDQHVREVGVDSPEFELAELMGQVLEAPAPQASLAGEANLFDQVLGQELERAEAAGGLSTFFVAGESKQTEPGDSDTKPPLGSPLADTVADEPLEAERSRRWPLALALALFLAMGLGGALLWGGDGDVEPLSAAADAGTSVNGTPSDLARRAESPRDVGLPDAASLARLVLRPSPAGGRVWLDGKPQGTTPLSLSRLGGKSVSVRIETPGYRRFEQQVVLRPGATLTLEPALKRVARVRSPRGYGYLSVNSEPWAVVFVDGKRLKSTPVLRHRLRVGRHRVVLKNPSKAKVVRRVIVCKGQETRVSVMLK
jgi:serine/threonine protein kinase